MALEDEMTSEEGLTSEEKSDLRIMVNLAKNMIDEGGSRVIEQAMNSSDPGQVIGQFLLQLGDEIDSNLPRDVKPSPRIMLIEDGWVEQVSDYLQEEYDVPEDVMDRAEMFIGSSAEAMASSEQQQQAPVGMPQEAMANG